MGGLELAIEQIAKATVNPNCQPTVYFLDDHPKLAKRDGIVEIPASLWRTVWSMAIPTVSAWWALGHALRAADVVHYHVPWPIADLAQLLFRPNAPTVVTYHADLVRQKRVEPLYAIVRNCFFRCVDRIVVTTPTYAQGSTALRGFARKTVSIPLCLVDLPNYPCATENPPIRPFILFLGVLRYYKGLDSLISAAKLTGINVKIVGDGEQMPALQSRIAVEGIANVELCGRLPEAQKLALLNRCVALVLPSTSRAEAFGMVLLEAMRAAKPVITTNIDSGMRYVCEAGETGLTIPPNNPAALGEAMRRLVNAPELARQMGENGRKRYLARFTPAVVGHQYIELYQQLLDERR